MAKRTSPTATTANLGFEAKLWHAADAERSIRDVAEHNHVDLLVRKGIGANRIQCSSSNVGLPIGAPAKRET